MSARHTSAKTSDDECPADTTSQSRQTTNVRQTHVHQIVRQPMSGRHTSSKTPDSQCPTDTPPPIRRMMNVWRTRVWKNDFNRWFLTTFAKFVFRKPGDTQKDSQQRNATPGFQETDCGLSVYKHL